MLGGKVDILKILAVARKRAFGFTLAIMITITIRGGAGTEDWRLSRHYYII